ncbi:DUF3857 domain-containing protein [Winogradskyella psychrotolerans]|uniref:DUF3857 domain-containing protein n=1 Tax=Winogradskyella psychrotolerans TaxID=1344585 RepID=UPI001C067EF0|nr:DUF3857 domain-containing protein [Winogradskyella psychrotolerans]MBU2928442.1 DUF3857 domain-containing protein [Winogradskyella psychrotolerans]
MKIKGLTAFLLLFSVSVFSQSKEELAAKDFFWGANDAYKNVIEVPEKWAKESAVILYKNENYDFHKFGKNVTYTSSIRQRIKLLDKAAVEEFSEFAFKKRFRSDKGRYSWKEKGNNYIGVKIVKPNGTEIEINVEEESVEVDGETKVAIANLEIGDIIDYYFYRLEPFKTTYAFGFSPVETYLGEEYPVVDFKLFFETENDFFINFNSFNGAPKLTEIATEKRSIRRYELVASDIEKIQSTRWTYPLLELPSYKFQVYFARSGKFEDRALAFLPEKEDIIKTSVSKDEVLELYDNRFKPDGDVGDVKRFFKQKTFANDSEKVTEAYYFMRHYYLTRFVEAMIVKDAEIMSYPFVNYGNPVFIQSQKQFVRHFTEFLKREKIKYEIVVAKKRYDGSIEDLLIEKNVNVLIKVKTATPLYAELFSIHTNINEFSPLIEDTEVYLLSPTKNKIDVIEKGKLPVSTHLDNETKKDIIVSLNDDFSEINLTAVNSYKGHSKKDEQYERLMFTDYVTEDYAKYETESFIDLIKRKKNKIRYKKELDAVAEKIKAKQIERFENSAKAEFQVEDLEDYTYEINETGRYALDAYLIFTERFKAKNTLIKKAGPNYILEIGKLIGGQIDLEEKEHQRTSNIYTANARSFNYSITLNVPEGYTISGLEKLNKSVDNETGAFISTAKIEGDQLIINTSKQYKHNFELSNNWSKMMAFLDEANQFTNEKILLKKK